VTRTVRWIVLLGSARWLGGRAFVSFWHDRDLDRFHSLVEVPARPDQIVGARGRAGGDRPARRELAGQFFLVAAGRGSYHAGGWSPR
jgi:hypothetical protein